MCLTIRNEVLAPTWGRTRFFRMLAIISTISCSWQTARKNVFMVFSVEGQTVQSNDLSCLISTVSVRLKTWAPWKHSAEQVSVWTHYDVECLPCYIPRCFVFIRKLGRTPLINIVGARAAALRSTVRWNVLHAHLATCHMCAIGLKQIQVLKMSSLGACCDDS